MQDNNYTSYRTPKQYRGAAVQHGRSSAATLYLTVGAAIVAALAALLSVNVFFNLRTSGVNVTGTDLYSSEQIQYVGGIVDGQNLIRMNTDYIAGRLKSNLVYIDDVSIEKHYLEGGLDVKITQAVPAAQLDVGGSYCTLSESGRILENDLIERTEELPLVVGYDLKDNTSGAKVESKDEQKTEILTMLFEQIKELGFENIGKIDLTDRTDIKLMYDDRVELCLGSAVDMDIKLLYFKTVIDSGLPDGYVGTLIYRGLDAGISAIPKEVEVPSQSADSSSLGEDSSFDDSSEAQSVYGEDIYGDDSSYYDDYYDDGYSDDGNYDEGYYDDGYSDDGNYDYGYSDDGYNGDYTVYDDGYSDYGNYGYEDQSTDWNTGYGY